MQSTGLSYTMGMCLSPLRLRTLTPEGAHLKSPEPHGGHTTHPSEYRDAYRACMDDAERRQMWKQHPTIHEYQFESRYDLHRSTQPTKSARQMETKGADVEESRASIASSMVPVTSL